MPKIEVNEELFYTLAGRRWKAREEFESALTCAKAELDEDSDKTLAEIERILKIELNDTNRPDLWSTAGCARQLRVYHTGKKPFYPFFSAPGAMKDAKKHIIVEETVKGVRPYIAGFIAKGKTITDASLRDVIQTQEKIAWNYGRKRRTVSMGLYRAAAIKWPVRYKGVDPDSVSFVPLQWDSPLTLREILKQHPKGKEYAFIQENEPLHPLLLDSGGGILSYPPIINSADLGAVQVGDSELFIEITGTGLHAVTLSASIVACDFADQGYEIEPVDVRSAFDTAFGKLYTTPFYFQEPVFCSLERIEKYLGEKLDGKECAAALERMGCDAERITALERGVPEGTGVPGILCRLPPYRNDYLHAADVMEDVMIGRGLSSFTPQKPAEFTMGRLSPITILSRKVKAALVGMGYQEMIYNYLGSREELVDMMSGNAAGIVRIANPMSEKFEYVRDSILPNLMKSEQVSANAAYPHRIFETGKVAFKDAKRNYGTATRQYAAFLYAAQDANFNTLSAQIQTLFYYLNREFEVAALDGDDARFIRGRAAQILYKGGRVGEFGEVHPAVLEAFNVEMPCAACEIDLDYLLR
ncbi:MAG: phenylalanine--tRNA ligase subunit beta [Spirochaetaceae bacterium]|jgi:phenylalanyl-tRNA synthetase beta chain|nr:phenylalanine--tRNA ligase subunit beta [Spirochaetaceae bacterium]